MNMYSDTGSHDIWQPVPNGKYKFLFKVNDSLDESIFTVKFWYEQSYHFYDMDMK